MRRADIEVPNPPVDVDSRAGSACYPRSTFYPLIFGAPTRHRRVTKPCFRTCSRCPSRSQAPLCLCTLRAVTNRAEGTFGRLRYPLGGGRPSQTAHQTLSPARIHGSGLEPRHSKGGISPAAPREPESPLLSLPPILRMPCQSPISGCSKGSGVFSSRRGYPASSPELQFRRVPRRDSAPVVTPFVQVGNYPTRNFATLGPL